MIEVRTEKKTNPYVPASTCFESVAHIVKGLDIARGCYVFLFDGLVKIGFSTSIRERIKRHCWHKSKENPIVLLRIYLHRDASKLETSLHNSVKDSHVNGEWFDLCNSDLSTLDKVAEDIGASIFYSQSI